jgi:undecaprenyl-diphosphatase
MMLEAIILGLVQGLTEWLPISSSGHLIIVKELLKIEVSLLFYVMLHFGTLIAVFAYFWKDIVKILKSLVKFDFKSESGKLIPFIIIGSIPVSVVGFIFYNLIEGLFDNLFTTSIALIVTGIILFLTKFTKSRKDLTSFDSLLIGLAQGFALIPGISRSGTTISAGLFRGVKKELVFKFSFLLSIPAILAANLLEFSTLIFSNTSVDFVSYITGTAIAAIVGYLSLKFLFKMLKKEKFYLFSFYCLVIGLILLIIT